MVQWLKIRATTAGGMGLIPGWETKIPHARVVWTNKKKSENKYLKYFLKYIVEHPFYS